MRTSLGQLWSCLHIVDGGRGSAYSHYLRTEAHRIAGWSSLVARRAHNPKVIGSNPVPAIWSLGVGVITPPCHGGDHRSESGRDRNGSIAQLVEQRIEAPCVGGSIPSRAIRKQEVAGIV